MVKVEKVVNNPEQALKRIIAVMAKLRDPANGCPWDNEQTWCSLVEHTLEEAYEVADAIESATSENSSYENVAEELGDLLFQVVFYAQIADEQNLFNLQDVIHKLCDKLEQRHPHVFADADYTKEQLEQARHQSKSKERALKDKFSVLDDVPLALPALTRAQKLQRRCSNEGFDWRHTDRVFEKINEEIDELKQAIKNNNPDEIKDEMGDVFFTLVNLARHLELDSETCLRQSSQKFERRYRALEEHFKQQNKNINDVKDDDLAAYWDTIKQQE